MKRFIEYLEDNGHVINVFIYDGESDYFVPSGSAIKELEEDSQVGIGWTLNEDGSFTEPPVTRYAIFKKTNGEVVSFSLVYGFNNFVLPESQQVEYDVAVCEGAAEIGWIYSNGLFAPNQLGG